MPLARKLVHAGVLCLLLTLAIMPVQAETDSASGQPVVHVLQVDGTVTAGLASYLRQGLEEAVAADVDAVVIVLDTPGGLVEATLDIVQDILEAPVPVLTYVAPRGAIAASAGTFILLSGHRAGMSPGTTCGAAMPVMIAPGEESQAADEKTISFFAGHMRTIAEARDRPQDIAERFVTENLTLNAGEALEQGVVDVVADDLEEFLVEASVPVEIDGELVELDLAGARIVEREMTTRQQIQHILSDPQVAFLLFMLGLYGVIFGLNMPGTFVPEMLGAIALILALYGLGMFEVNVVGLLLIILSVVLFVIEVFTPTFGILTAGGVTALILGALLLPVEPMLPGQWFRSFWFMVLGMGAVTALFFLGVVASLVRLRRRPPVQGDQEFRDLPGVVLTDLSPQGQVRVRGEIWQARSRSGGTIPSGTPVRVARRQGMVLEVEAGAENEAEHPDDKELD